MASLRKLVSDVALYTIGALLAYLIIYAIGVSVQYIPMMEARIFPVVDIAPIKKEDTYREHEKACFDLHLTKLRTGPPADYVFFGDTTSKTSGVVSSPKLGLSAYTATPQHKRDLVTWTEHKVGEKWARTWCFETPGTIADWQPITVTGTAYHHRHWFYDSPTAIAPFTIPPIRQSP